VCAKTESFQVVEKFGTIKDSAVRRVKKVALGGQPGVGRKMMTSAVGAAQDAP